MYVVFPLQESTTKNLNGLTYYDATGAEETDLFFQSHPGAPPSISARSRWAVCGLRLAAAPLPWTRCHPQVRASVSLPSLLWLK